MQSPIFQRFQPNNKRGIAKSCQICNKNFSVLSIDYQHQCKRCIRPICKQCGKTKRDVYKLDMIKNPHRLCSICLEQSDFIKQYIITNKLEFGKDSPLGKKWLNKIPQIPQQQGSGQQSEIYPIKINNKLTYQIFTTMWNSYNYSLRQFIGLLTYQKNQKDIYKYINIVYQQLLRKGYDEKLQNILIVIIFILCFSNARTASKIIQYLLILKKSIIDNKQLLQIYLKTLKIQQLQSKKISQYLTNKFKQYINNFSINVLSFQCTINIITKLIQKDKIQYQFIIFAIVIQDNFQYLLKNKNNKIQCDLQLVKKSKIKKYLQKQKQLGNVKISQFINKTKATNNNNNNSNSNNSNKSPQSYQDSPNRTQISSTNIDLFRDSKKQKDKDKDKQKDLDKESINSRSRQMADNLSSKTRSIRDQSYRQQYQSSQRKTQKPLLIPKFSDMSSSSPDNDHTEIQHQYINQSGQCYQCQKNMKKIEDLQSKLKLKQRQIQSLNFKLSFRKKQTFQQQTKSKNNYQNQLLYKKYENINKPQQNNGHIFSQQNQYRKQNIILRAKIQQLQTNIRILKSNLPSQSPFSTSSNFNSTSNTSNTKYNKIIIQQDKSLSTLKNVLQTKNKQLQQIMKKNKLLNYQIQQMQRQYSLRKPQATTQGTRQELLKKLQELAIKVNQQQDQKIQISEELFNLKLDIRNSELNLSKLKNKQNGNLNQNQNQNKKNNKQCAIF